MIINPNRDAAVVEVEPPHQEQGEQDHGGQGQRHLNGAIRDHVNWKNVRRGGEGGGVWYGFTETKVHS